MSIITLIQLLKTTSNPIQVCTVDYIHKPARTLSRGYLKDPTLVTELTKASIYKYKDEKVVIFKNRYLVPMFTKTNKPAGYIIMRMKIITSEIFSISEPIVGEDMRSPIQWPVSKEGNNETEPVKQEYLPNTWFPPPLYFNSKSISDISSLDCTDEIREEKTGPMTDHASINHWSALVMDDVNSFPWNYSKEAGVIKNSILSHSSQSYPHGFLSVTRHPETNSMSRHPETNSISRHPETNSMSTHPETNSMSRHTKTNSISRHPETNSMSRHPETNSMSRHPESNSISRHPETNSISRHPETNSMSTHPETNSISRYPETNSISRHPETNSIFSPHESNLSEHFPCLSVLYKELSTLHKVVDNGKQKTGIKHQSVQTVEGEEGEVQDKVVEKDLVLAKSSRQMTKKLPSQVFTRHCCQVHHEQQLKPKRKSTSYKRLKNDIYQQEIARKENGVENEKQNDQRLLKPNQKCAKQDPITMQLECRVSSEERLQGNRGISDNEIEMSHMTSSSHDSELQVDSDGRKEDSLIDKELHEEMKDEGKIETVQRNENMKSDEKEESEFFSSTSDVSLSLSESYSPIPEDKDSSPHKPISPPVILMTLSPPSDLNSPSSSLLQIGTSCPNFLEKPYQFSPQALGSSMESLNLNETEGTFMNPSRLGQKIYLAASQQSLEHVGNGLSDNVNDDKTNLKSVINNDSTEELFSQKSNELTKGCTIRGQEEDIEIEEDIENLEYEYSDDFESEDDS